VEEGLQVVEIAVRLRTSTQVGFRMFYSWVGIRDSEVSTTTSPPYLHREVCHRKLGRRAVT